tara:strand:+ start:151 stop:675 length:525 start_codon:yes stop_codon:yes gene_type:complete
MAILKYVGTVINNINGFKQSTRPKNVGQLSDMIQEYKDTTDTPSKTGWVEYYDWRCPAAIDTATDKTWEGIQELIVNLQSLTKEDVKDWTKDLIIDKTFDGLFWQEEILRQSSKTGEYRLATPEEEAKGIDGIVDGEFVSIKPDTYKQTVNSKQENIDVRIIYYKKLSRGFKLL